MVTYVLDSSAVLRYLDGEAGADRISEIIEARLSGACDAVICALHWGEIAGLVCRRHGVTTMEKVLSRLNSLGVVATTVDGDRAVRAALIKMKRAIPYVDAFGIELTGDPVDRIFVTADYDFKPASRDVKIEFLPKKK
jgi:PIN domain nuclease of toxin-antitoxin system